MTVSVINDDGIRIPELIGDTLVNLREVVVPGGAQSDRWLELRYRGKYAGAIRIKIIYEDSKPEYKKTSLTMPYSVLGGVPHPTLDEETGPSTYDDRRVKAFQSIWDGPLRVTNPDPPDLPNPPDREKITGPTQPEPAAMRISPAKFKIARGESEASPPSKIVATLKYVTKSENRHLLMRYCSTNCPTWQARCRRRF
jgi:hypothetical protein